MPTEPTATSSDRSIDSIVADHSAGLMAYISSRIPRTEDAEDILQEVFLQLVTHSNNAGADQIEKVTSWLYRVAHNAIANFWRKKREVSATSLFDSYDEAFVELADVIFCDDSESPDAKYMRGLVWAELEEALIDMPQAQSEVFCQTVFEGLPIKEISRQTGITQATLLSRKHYAVTYLRKRFRDLYDDIVNH